MMRVLELLGFMIQSLITLTLLAAALILFAGLVVFLPVAIGLLVYHVLMKLSNRRHGPVSEKCPWYELPSIVRRQTTNAHGRRTLSREEGSLAGPPLLRIR